jgi:hypothetical protein
MAYEPIQRNDNKKFEKPPTAQYNATIIDYIELGKKTNTYGETKDRVRVVWVLDKNDSENRPFRVSWDVNKTIADQPKKSNLYEIIEGVFGTAPPVFFDPNTLIGRSNMLVVVKTPPDAKGNEWANIKAILPLPAGVVPPPIPQGFVRAKDKAQRTQVSNGAPAVATTATVVVPPAVAQPVNVVATQPVPATTAAPATPTAAPQPQVDAAF